MDALEDYLARWTWLHLSCEPADRRTAEAGVRLAYAEAGLPTAGTDRLVRRPS